VDEALRTGVKKRYSWGTLVALDPSHGGPVVGVVGLSSRSAHLARRRSFAFVVSSKLRCVSEGILHGHRLALVGFSSILDLLFILVFILSQEGDQLRLGVMCADASWSLHHGTGGRRWLAVASELFSAEGLGLVGQHQVLRVLIKNLAFFHSHLGHVHRSLLLGLQVVALRRKVLGLDDFRVVEGLADGGLCRDLRYSLVFGVLAGEESL